MVAWMKTWGRKEVLVAWMKSCRAEGGAGGMDEELGAG